ncbi:hypothetical protein [Segatella buccae]
MKNKIRNWLLSFPLLALAGCQKHQSQTVVFIPLSGVKAYYIENRNDTIDIFQVSHQNGVYHLAWKIYKEKRAYYINLLGKKELFMSASIPADSLYTTISEKPFYKIDIRKVEHNLYSSTIYMADSIYGLYIGLHLVYNKKYEVQYVENWPSYVTYTKE